MDAKWLAGMTSGRIVWTASPYRHTTGALLRTIGGRHEDSQRAIRFLQEAFGFTVQELHEGSDRRVDHALLAYGNSLVMINSRREGTAFDHGPYALYCAVHDPDAHHARAIAAGAKVAMPLTDQPYGSREYTVRDPEGNLWSFGTYQQTVIAHERQPQQA